MTREEAIAQLKEINREVHIYSEAVDMAIEALVEPEGQWIRKPRVYGVVYCSNCDYELRIPNSNYCPNCGHKMALETVEMRDDE